MSDWPNSETAWVALLAGIADHQFNLITSGEWVMLILDAALGTEPVYQEPVKRCLHPHLSDYKVCDDCGAQLQWVVQVWPHE